MNIEIVVLNWGLSKRKLTNVQECFTRNGVAQPDDREHRQGGEEEACMAVLNDFYGDGGSTNLLFSFISASLGKSFKPQCRF